MTHPLPRLLAIMGSGETAPTLAKVHRALFARLGEAPNAVLVDTPYGFQGNADDISARTVDYFRESVGVAIGVASYRSSEADGLTRSRAVARIAAADAVFAGPGSPSYALRQWQGSEIPGLLAEKLAHGGVLTFASAAALTLGCLTVPVYEIYKVGETPHWLEGLDLLGPLGLRVAVVPHYDNAEGGNHDTRFCYLGAERLARLEAELPADTWILGIDGHTALILDLDARTATVAGLGGVTARVRGGSRVFPTGSTLTLDELIAAGEGATGTPGERGAAGAAGAAGTSGPTSVSPGGEPTDLVEAVRRAERDFEAALGARSVAEATRVVLDLDEVVAAWAADMGDTGERSRARASVRALVVRLGELGERGVQDPREPIAPFVEALLEVRDRARAARDWASADLVRDRLTAAGVEVRDAPEGTRWELDGSEPAHA